MVTDPSGGWHPTRSSVWGWVLYDLANTIFALGVGGLYFPDWLTQRGLPDGALSVVQATAGAVVVVSAPWVGRRTDHFGKRLPTLVGTTLLAVAATAALGVGPSLTNLVMLGAALIGFNVGSVVYDAMLPDVSTEADRGRVSGLGVAVGYLGSFVGLGIGSLTLDVLHLSYAATFRALAAGFFVFSIPAFLLVRERPRRRRPGDPPSLRSIVTDLLRSWRRARAYSGVVRFLVARFLYTDAINTLIGGFLTIFVIEELGFDRAFARDLLGVAIAAAVAGGLVGGRMVQRWGPAPVLRGILVVWLAAIATVLLAASTGARGIAWVIGPVGGFALGATWASDRVVMARVAPPRYFGEFYGLYATVGRFGTILGPLTWGLVVDVLGWGRRAAMGALMIFIAAALVTLLPLDDRVRSWSQVEQEA